MRSTTLIAIIIALLAPLARADATWPGKLREYTAPGYTLITEFPREERRVASILALLGPTIEKVLDRKTVPPGTPTIIYIVRGPVWKQYLSPGDSKVADFAAARFANYILIDS